jgi:hypothetical protein
VITNTVEAEINGSTVSAVGGISLHASDEAPSLLTVVLPDKVVDLIEQVVPTDVIDLDANILAVMISVAGSGNVAVNAAVMGNVIANTVRARIVGDNVADFDAAATGAIDAAEDTITVPSHGFVDGQFITYRAEDNARIGGLQDGLQYKVEWVNADTFKLRNLLDDSLVNIELLPPAGTHSFVRAEDPKTFNPTAPGPVDYEYDSITLIGHGFDDGDLITYDANGNNPIGGLQDGQQYVVVRIDADTFKLKQDFQDTNPVDLTLLAPSGDHGIVFKGVTQTITPSAGGVDFGADAIHLAAHGFSGGEIVTYAANGNDSIGGLVDGRQYEVVFIDDNEFGLKGLGSSVDLRPPDAGGTHSLVFEGEATSVTTSEDVNYSENIFTISDHGFSDGDIVTYRANGNDPIDGLDEGREYEVVDSDDDTFGLKRLGEAVDLSPSPPGGNHGFIHGIDVQSITPSIAGPVDYVNDTVSIRDHGFSDEQIVVYHADGPQSIGALVDGENYQVELIDNDTFGLKSADGTASIDLTDTSAWGTHSFVAEQIPQSFTPSSGEVNCDENVFTVTNHGFIDGEKILYDAVGNEPIAGLTEGIEYEVEWIDADHFKLIDPLSITSLSFDPNVSAFLFPSTPTSPHRSIRMPTPLPSAITVLPAVSS